MEKLDFGKKLIETREANGLTQAEVAEMCKIATRTIQRIETGVVKPRAFTIKLISETLGFDFFEASNTGYDVKIENQVSNSESHSFLWNLKDLFNLKTNAMKKLSILSSTALITILSLFAINSSLFAQSNDVKNSMNIEYNPDKSVSRIEVRFTNVLTYDSLTYIKSTLENYNIKVNYKRIDFDDNNGLKYLSCKVTSEVGSGSLSMSVIDERRIAGFYCDYTAQNDDDKSSFCIGGCFKKE